jgi:ATP-binding cassette subfamily F protein uup
MFRGKRLQVAYFDQQRDQLDPDAKVMDSISDGSESVTIKRPHTACRRVSGRFSVFPPNACVRS